MNRQTSSRTPLDREAWILCAIDTLAVGGLAELRVEALAKRLKVTKGSFYWHFAGRKDFLIAVLQHWRDGRIRDIHKQTRSSPGKEHAQLLHVLDVYSAPRSRRGMMIELAIRDWALRDADARAVVAAVDAERLACARQLFMANGLSHDEAASRSTLLYAYVFGLSLMILDEAQMPATILRQQIAGLIAGHELRPSNELPAH